MTAPFPNWFYAHLSLDGPLQSGEAKFWLLDPFTDSALSRCTQPPPFFLVASSCS
jgi:hypothetical protein